MTKRIFIAGIGSRPATAEMLRVVFIKVSSEGRGSKDEKTPAVKPQKALHRKNI